MPPCHQCDIVERLTRMETTLDLVSLQLLGGDGKPGRCAEHECELKRLDRWRSRLTGALVVISFLLTAGVTIGGVILAAKLKSP